MTTSALSRSAGEASGATIVAMSQEPVWASRFAHAPNIAGATNGMSPWRLITASWRPDGSSILSAAMILSEPEGRSGSVSKAQPPAASTTATISGSPAATATGPMSAAWA